MLKRLHATLDQLIELQNQLINFAEKKRVILIERKIDDLDALGKKETELLKQLGHLEAERQQLVDQLLQPYPELGFQKFVYHLEDELMKKKLQTQLVYLQELLIDLQAKNKTNEFLLLDAMNFVHHMIAQVTKSKQQNFNYQSPLGQSPQQITNQGFFDTKA